MLLTITIVLILTIAAVTWFVNKALPFAICPICAGVFLTWVGLVGVYFLGYTIDLLVPAILMGGSVVGTTYQLEKKFNGQSQGARMFWKVLFMPAGFVAVYAVLEQLWTVLLLAVVFLVVVATWFLFARSKPDSGEQTTGDLEKKMKDCC